MPDEITYSNYTDTHTHTHTYTLIDNFTAKRLFQRRRLFFLPYKKLVLSDFDSLSIISLF